MSQYKAYPAYKDSGVEWIGQVPEHWEVARVKRLATLRNERRSDVSTETTYIGLEDVEAGSGKYKPTNGSSRQSEDSTVGIFYEGDVLYGKLRPYLRKAIVSEMEGCCSTEFLVLRAEKTEPKWLQEWLLTPDVTHQIESGCEGAKMPRADWWHVGSIEAVYPDQDEQAQILATLDRETARIDALIGKKTRFIELLKEKRQALITHAVTKGLDPNVKMKDSGVEWIGQVPEHWEVKPFKYILSAPMSYGANESAESDDPNHPRYIRITDLTENGTLREDTFKTLPWDKAYSYLLSDGDILLARSGATVGKSFLYRETNGAACFAGYLIKASCDEEKALPKYIYAYLQSHSYWEYISGSNIQSTIQNVSAEKYSSMVLPVPQREEQATIAATLDRETARIDTLIGKAEQSITLLKERRSAFITAAVTGQIDLRGEQ